MARFHSHNLRIATRVWLGFGSVIVAIVAVVGAVEFNLGRSLDQWAEVGRDRGVQVQAGQAHLLAKDNAIASLSLLVSPSAEQQRQLAEAIAKRNTEITALLTELERAAATDAEVAPLLAEVRKRHRSYAGGVKRIGDMVLAGKQAEAAFAAEEEMLPMMAPFFAALAQLDEALVRNGHRVEADNTALLHQTQWIGLLAGALAVVMAAAAGVLLVRSVTGPLAGAIALAQSVQQGDLTRRVLAEGRNEAALLLQAMNAMSDNLTQVIAEVRSSSENVANASAEIAQGNMDLSGRTETQASALQETAASMDQLASTVRQTAERAAQANELARSATASAQSGGHIVTDVVTTMRGIQDSSRRIAEIVAVIDGIAFQTNILALNAAVEAARAGEQGRGFAVVATEVRQLAQRSARAAREIKTLIDTSVARVEQGAQLADKAGASMQQIVASIGHVNTIVGEISVASGEQSAGVAQVGHAVTQMDATTQQNAALVEQSAAAAASLRTQAEQLAAVVARFRLAA